MSVVIGCSGSTGSSLLKTILNRHSQIFAGPEALLFAFPQVYEEWGNCKKQLLTTIKTDAWQMRKGMALVQPAFGWNTEDLQQLIANANSFKDFVAAFFAKPLQRDQKQIWVEKSPANAVGLAAFLQNFPEGKVVQTIRNPYDTIASLTARGMNTYVATAYYVYNTAIATSNHQNARYYQLKYEELVEKPTFTLTSLCTFLDVPFEPEILVAQHEKRAEPTAMSGWKHEETGKVKASSIGRFQELAQAEKAIIRAAFAHFKISENYRKKYQIQFENGEDLCEYLGYEYLPSRSKNHHILLRKYQWRDRLSRVKHGFWWQFFDYPGAL